MPTIGPTELIIVLVIVLVLFGAGKLPEIGRGLGRSIRGFRNAIRDDGSARSTVEDGAAERCTLDPLQTSSFDPGNGGCRHG